MRTYIIETTDNATQIGYTGTRKYSVRVSQGAGVGIYRRKLAVAGKTELSKRLNELADRNTTVMRFPNDESAKKHARELEDYLNS